MVSFFVSDQIKNGKRKKSTKDGEDVGKRSKKNNVCLYNLYFNRR